MLGDDRIDLIGRIARLQHVQNELGDVITERSVLALCAASFGAKPDPDSTAPTGFDPLAVILFEAIVEAAFLVASADGHFDEAERETFGRILTAACGGAVPPRRIAQLVLDLSDMLHEDGLDARLHAIGGCAQKPEHAREILRIGVLIADATGGIEAAERHVLERLAGLARLQSTEIDAVIAAVRTEVASGHERG